MTQNGVSAQANPSPSADYTDDSRHPHSRSANTDTLPPQIIAHLRRIITRAGDDNIPLLRDLNPADINTPQGQASIARAALAWLTDGDDTAIAHRLATELEQARRAAA